MGAMQSAPANITQRRNEISFFGGVSVENIEEFRDALERANAYVDTNPMCTSVKLRINSGGGCMNTGLYLYDLIRISDETRHPITAIVCGFAASAATLLALGASTRTMSAHSTQLIHQLSACSRGTYQNIQDNMKNCDVYMENAYSIYAERTNLSREFLEEQLKHDIEWTAEECLDYGLIHYVTCEF